jgi:prepilin-type N-terminal cleavage/methylation domain-containing protein
MRSRQGYSMMELVVVMAVIGIIASVWIHAGSGEPARASMGLVRTLVSMRHRAIVAGVDAHVFGSCSATLPSAPGVSVQTPSRGLLFTPDGLPRTCDGGGVGNTTILLEYRGRQAAVIVSSLGRVRWEMR